MADLGAITGDPVDPAPGRSRAELLSGIEDGAVEKLFSGSVDPLLTVQLRHLGGALTTQREGSGPAARSPSRICCTCSGCR
ncbi:hypothetical protein NKG05_15285 [Oerskovia sp. M15]